MGGEKGFVKLFDRSKTVRYLTIDILVIFLSCIHITHIYQMFFFMYTSKLQSNKGFCLSV